MKRLRSLKTWNAGGSAGKLWLLFIVWPSFALFLGFVVQFSLNAGIGTSSMLPRFMFLLLSSPVRSYIHLAAIPRALHYLFLTIYINISVVLGSLHREARPMGASGCLWCGFLLRAQPMRVPGMSRNNSNFK